MAKATTASPAKAAASGPAGDDEQPAPVGRPRASGRAVSGSARDDIVAVAIELFTTRGYAPTTMAQIAKAAGLRQSSLYYYFSRKELILAAAFDVTRAPAELLRQLRRDPGGAAPALYRLVRFDARQLCRATCDVNDVWRVAVVETELFEPFWADRRELHKRVEALVTQGVRDGSFVDVDVRLAALTLVAANDGSQAWWRQRGDLRLDGRAAGRPPRYDAAELAEHLAASALRSVLRRPAQLTAIQREAARYDDETFSR